LNLDYDWVINVMAAAAVRSMKGIAALQQRFAIELAHRPNEFGTDDRIKFVLTKKGKYGLKAMVHLAGLEPGELA
jgi:hypothetical protein